MRKQCDKYSNFFKILSDEKRMTILKDLNKCNCGKCGQDILELTDISQPTLSHHIKLLTDNEILIPNRNKNKISYDVNNEKIIQILESFIEEIKTESSCKVCSSKKEG